MFPASRALLSAVWPPLCTKKVRTYHCLLLNNKPWRISIFITFDKESRRLPVRKTAHAQGDPALGHKMDIVIN